VISKGGRQRGKRKNRRVFKGKADIINNQQVIFCSTVKPYKNLRNPKNKKLIKGDYIFVNYLQFYS